ncbi:MAG: DNA repair protein RadC [Verrucomicrobiia bacterium]
MAADQRPRERLSRRGPEALRTAELLAILLRTGIAGRSALNLGEHLLAHFGSLERLARTPVAELANIKGIGPAKAVQLAAAFALGSRLAAEHAIARPMNDPATVAGFLGHSFRQLSREVLRVISLSTRLELIACDEASAGTVNETVAHPRDILRFPLLHHAYGFILAHNHPSGDPTPSQADHALTLRLREAGLLMQIPLIDHIIIGNPRPDYPTGYYSFKEAGYL